MRGIVARTGLGVFVCGAGLLPLGSAQAQSFTWGGTGSSTITTDYNLDTNWSIPPAGAPPVTAGQTAVFDSTGNSTVSVTAGSIAPDSWIFSTNAQSFTISGGAVSFSRAGASGGIIDTAVGQTISIANNIGESVAGAQVQLLGASTLILSGNNTYSGGTLVGGGGALQVTSGSSVGSGTVTLDNGLFQAGANLTLGNNFRVNASAFGSSIDANGNALTISGNITDGNGPGQLTLLDSSFGSGQVILTGTNTYSGGTIICTCATLQLGDATHTGSIVGAVTNEGNFVVLNANTAGITSITNDSGQTDFFNASTAGSATILNQFSGATVFHDFSSAMNANITNSSTGGATAFLDHATAGNATVTNRGLLIFTDSRMPAVRQSPTDSAE